MRMMTGVSIQRRSGVGGVGKRGERTERNGEARHATDGLLHTAWSDFTGAGGQTGPGVAAAAAAKVSAEDSKTSPHREISTATMTPEQDCNAFKASYSGNKQIHKASDH